MFIADYHMHTDFSSDSTAKMSDMIEQSIKLGLKEIAITDHVDFDYPDKDFPFLIDYSQYTPVFNNLKDKYSNKINIIFGVEIGLQPHIEKDILTLCQDNPFDFIIGSTHCADKFDLCKEDFFIGKTQKEAYSRYFENVLESILQYPQLCVYGHLDFINRYGNYPNPQLKYSDFSEIIDQILSELISRGKGIEINTSGFKYGLGITHPQFDIIKRYKTMGGEILTIGSDAHSPEYIANHFKDAYDMAKEAGFKAITLFKDKNPRWEDII